MSKRENDRKKTGLGYSGYENIGKSGTEEKFHAERGHGFAAERANDLYDNMTGKDARIVGDDNAKDGVDRIVNGTSIQSKYCANGSRCIKECYNNSGEFRYYLKDSNGNYIRDANGLRKPMQIEVPPNDGNNKIYDDAVEAMQKRIDEGKGPDGVKDAREIIRKGNVTYEQAKNIAKAGTVDSLTYDAIEGVKIGAYSGGISAAVTFAVSTWNGKSFEEALEQSVVAGLQTGGIAWASSILVGQMTKAGVNSLLVPYSDAVVNMLGNKATSALANALRGEGAKEIAGAAAKNYLSKFLRGNAVTGVATVLIASTGDVLDIFRGRISGGQLVKNVVNTSAGVAGGVGGWTVGASAGALLGSTVPFVGTAVGGFVGGLLGAIFGGSTAGKVSQTVTDQIIEDDAKEMMRILNTEFKYVAIDFMITEAESKKFFKEITSSNLKDMYASNNRPKFARELLVECADRIVKQRKKIYLPSTQDYVRGLRNVLEQSADDGQGNRSLQSSPKASEFTKKIFLEANEFYYGRNGRPKDKDAALRLYIQAAKAGNVDAQNKLMFLDISADCWKSTTQESVSQDFSSKGNILEQAAGDEQAKKIFLEANEFYYGRNGRPKDENTALRLYIQAAEARNVDAQNKLAFEFNIPFSRWKNK